METMTRVPPPSRVAERALATPDDAALTSADTGQVLTWSELDITTRRWAAGFLRLGVEPGETVVTVLTNTPEAIFTWLGIGWLKAVEVPLSVQLRGKWLVDAIETANARVVVLAPPAYEAFAEVANQLPGIEHVIVLTETDSLPTAQPVQSLVAGVDPIATSDPPQPWDVACGIYTSGTTGPPKLTIAPWGVFMAGTTTMFVPPVFDGMVYYSTAAPCHASGKSGLFAVLSKNGSLVIRETFSASGFWDDIREFNCTSMMMVATMASMLLAQPERASDSDNPLNAIYIGPAIPEVDKFRARFQIPHIFTCYGATETGSVLVNATVASASYTNCGKPGMDGPHVQLVDEHDQPVATGEQGELIMRPQIPWTTFAEYRGRAEETVRAWRNGWFHTGDLFRQNAAGDYIFVDRASGRIRRRGQNLAASEVERQIVAHEAVRECAVVPVSSSLGEDDIHAVVVLEDAAGLQPQDLAEFLVPRLPRYALPRYIEFVGELPRSEATLRVSTGELRSRGVSVGAWDCETETWVT